eukprot:3888271-Rhodomonas_salina.1
MPPLPLSASSLRLTSHPSLAAEAAWCSESALQLCQCQFSHQLSTLPRGPRPSLPPSQAQAEPSESTLPQLPPSQALSDRDNPHCQAATLRNQIQETTFS